ncbi:hypothetical protein M8C13_07465 [Crossiella sp. SN42]|uniref:hypothetical protein n=1 Tax=Crossiella sp. SN42 TaxID=2944808 RepID=UPI00207D56DC|nr:hypothetical protein [Crossiella sp. SN42]MCO1575595.1 hypothetical protein [Crossiella sp. SN42]
MSQQLQEAVDFDAYVDELDPAIETAIKDFDPANPAPSCSSCNLELTPAERKKGDQCENCADRAATPSPAEPHPLTPTPVEDTERAVTGEKRVVELAAADLPQRPQPIIAVPGVTVAQDPSDPDAPAEVVVPAPVAVIPPAAPVETRTAEPAPTQAAPTHSPLSTATITTSAAELAAFRKVIRSRSLTDRDIDAAIKAARAAWSQDKNINSGLCAAGWILSEDYRNNPEVRAYMDPAIHQALTAARDARCDTPLPQPRTTATPANAHPAILRAVREQIPNLAASDSTITMALRQAYAKRQSDGTYGLAAITAFGEIVSEDYKRNPARRKDKNPAIQRAIRAAVEAKNHLSQQATSNAA